MPSQLVAGDALPAVYEWAKDQPGVVAALGGNQIGFALPGITPPLPYLVIEFADETPLSTDGLMLNTRLQFSCWAKPFDAAKAGAVKNAVVSAAHNMTPGVAYSTPDGATVVLHGMTVDQVIWIPDADDGTARFTVDVIVMSTTSS